MHFIPDASGRSSGQAYVIFKNETEAQCGQRLDKEKLGTVSRINDDSYQCITAMSNATGFTPPSCLTPSLPPPFLLTPPPSILGPSSPSSPTLPPTGERWLDIFPSTLAEFNTTVNRGRPSADYGRGGGYTAAAAPQAQRPIGSASGGPSDMSSLSFVAKVRGLPFDCTRADLLYFFRDTDIKDNGVFFVSLTAATTHPWPMPATQ